jgi:hypothetical protein
MIEARAARDGQFRAALCAEAQHALAEGDAAAAKSMLRHVANAMAGSGRTGQTRA